MAVNPPRHPPHTPRSEGPQSEDTQRGVQGLEGGGVHMNHLWEGVSTCPPLPPLFCPVPRGMLLPKGEELRNTLDVRPADGRGGRGDGGTPLPKAVLPWDARRASGQCAEHSPPASSPAVAKAKDCRHRVSLRTRSRTQMPTRAAGQSRGSGGEGGGISRLWRKPVPWSAGPSNLLLLNLPPAHLLQPQR